jgi:glycosyltransferase involved in cell wall biosynthesis
MYFASSSPAGDPDGRTVRQRWLPWALRYTPARFSPGWCSYLGSAGFDRAVARQLPAGGELVHAFAGAAFRTFRRARALGYGTLHLESASAHVSHARRRYDEGYRAFPIERDWLGSRYLARALAEYAMADVIWVNSEYSRETFLAEGVPAAKLRRRELTIDPRFTPRSRRPANPGLHVMYVGSLTVSKGIPVLLEAFSRFPDRAARLTLVGGSGTRPMARMLAAARARDLRIAINPGDPLPHLRAADVFVHPSYSDGFGYAPAEALACGVPVIVTEDTGMKELITPCRTGWVVPTGSWQAILERLSELRNPVSHAGRGS